MRNLDLKLPRPEDFSECGGCGERFAVLAPSGLCPDCHDMREAEEARRTRLTQLPDERAEILQRRCLVPRRYAVTPFESPEPWPADTRGGDLEDWLGRPWSVVLAGDVGSGKSMLAVELLWRHYVVSEEQGAHIFLRGAEVVSLAFGQSGGLEGVTLQTIQAARFVVLDDLGAGVQGEAWAAFDRVLGPRYEEELPTVVTTNLGAQRLAGVHETGARIADRLSDGLWVRLPGDSRRGWPPSGPRAHTRESEGERAEGTPR